MWPVAVRTSVYHVSPIPYVNAIRSEDFQSAETDSYMSEVVPDLVETVYRR